MACQTAVHRRSLKEVEPTVLRTDLSTTPQRARPAVIFLVFLVHGLSGAAALVRRPSGPDVDHGRTGQGGHGLKSARSSVGMSASTSRVMPPPVPVSMPPSAAMTGCSPKASAFACRKAERAPTRSLEQQHLAAERVAMRCRDYAPAGAEPNRDLCFCAERRDDRGQKPARSVRGSGLVLETSCSGTPRMNVGALKCVPI